MRTVITASIIAFMAAGCTSEQPPKAKAPAEKPSAQTASAATTAKTPKAEPAQAKTAPAPPTIPQSEYRFHERRLTHQTRLQKRGPSPQAGQADLKPDFGKVVEYTQGLKAWLVRPKGVSGDVPAVVFLHGGYAFGGGDFTDALPFRDAGFALMTPILRGENGQPGDFEMMYGELNDAVAAVDWLAQQPGINAKRIYVFGHSVGANMAGMMSLMPDAKVRMTGGAGGIYPQEVWMGWSTPFDPRDTLEGQLRLFTPHIDDLVHPHVAYVGADDGLASFAPAVRATAEALKKPVTVIKLAGDHFSSLRPAILDFIGRIKAN